MNGSHPMPATPSVEQSVQNLREPGRSLARLAGMGVREPIESWDSAILQHDLAELDLPENVGVVDRLELQTLRSSRERHTRRSACAATWILGSLTGGFGVDSPRKLSTESD